MICEACGNKEAFRIIQSESGFKACDRCSNMSFTGIPDVYWPGRPHYNENLTDKMGNPVYLTSRRHKAEVMHKLGVMETGDRVGGRR